MALADFFPEYRSLAESIQAGRNDYARNQDEARRQALFEANQKQAALDLVQKQLATRGQLLSGVETQDQYAQILPQIQQLDLPTNDIPTQQVHPSQAWQTFAKPEAQRSQLPQWAQDQFKPAQPGVPQWMPQEWAPQVGGQMLGYDVPQQASQTNPMPTDLLQGPGEYDLSGLPQAAQRGLTIGEQQKSSGQDVRAELEAMRQALAQRRLDAYIKDIETRAPREDRKLALSEKTAQTNANINLAELGLKREGLQIEREKVAGADKPLAEAQSNAALFGRRVEQGIADLDRIYKQFDPTTVKAAFELSNAKAGGVRNAVTSPEAQEATQAERNIVTAILRKESGAAISAGEFATAEKQYFPRYGDSQGVIAQKRRNLEQALAGLKTAAGRGWERTPLVGGQGAPVTEASFSASWSKAVPGEKVLGPDGKYYVKKGGK
ncbi:hypothetical protein UFOVP602_43 [uncultured Caudovirales phage]|jgi:hypothetical protein|uniref:Uncharacterized protein n=1 Tax=uncultured Caudovirales phage TaxID=2100421 RepID=A0A6J5N7J8_9CAUD|nr:hypothetical protein UFOVP602_43 [uncultured Caudovirales phage]